jgi:predicted ATPase
LAKFFSLRENQEKEQLIVKWAEKLGLASFKAGWPGGNRLDSDYRDPILGTYLRTPLASYGARQILAVLAQLFASPPGSLLMIEEPEISLHPESQMLLPELFAEAIQRGVQVIITTHSIFLPLSLWRPISSKSLKHDQLAVYHVTKQIEGSQIEEIPVTNEGFLAKWVPSFTRAEEKSIKDLLKLAPSGKTID